MHAFLDDRGTDVAAALTFYAVLAIAPAAAALLSVVGLFESPQTVVDEILAVLREVASEDVVDVVAGILGDIATTEAASVAFVISLLLALWSASAFVTAFSRAMNTVHGVEEGRPFWVLRPLMAVLTVVLVAVAAVGLVLQVVSADLARALGGPIGLSDTFVTVFTWGRWPVLLLALVLLVSLLYHWTPNVRPGRYRVLSPGAAVAIGVILVASWGFSFYVANFASYDRTYGTLAGVVVALVWLWICSVILVLGAELDHELLRGRQLRAGLPAIDGALLPLRSTQRLEKDSVRRVEWAERDEEVRRVALALRAGGAADDDAADDASAAPVPTATTKAEPDGPAQPGRGTATGRDRAGG
ncbi:YihY/virulence factor BrkB family protein [Sanguibacter sp. HDW7]|uniref:YihY/virulence factor BrkB family protein n=1 Tax=Sanguibacter sp. HDW7 TaxID=2714931 RepID=UPI001409389F|nr:YihY/virulence factor BrkB family protein [Sanguibacter sp. HDW7]QIK82316.1 YihY/virulence factor BrkB family protein [Sanguibacter sp. HDW7]